MAISGDIESTDYNGIQTLMNRLIGNGDGSYGYGQDVKSSPVFVGNIITKAQWDTLRFDLLNARIHQTGSTPSIVLLQEDAVIDDKAADPVRSYADLAELASTERFNTTTEQTVLTNIGSPDYTSAWSTSAVVELTATFTTSNEARYFFNSGSTLNVTPTITGFTDTAQNRSWNNLFNEAGTQKFGASADQVTSYYELTNVYQTVYALTSSAAYASNIFRIEAKCDVANNSTGTARVIDLKITAADQYIDYGLPAPGDSVDGTLTITVDEQKANGVLQPSGTFSVVSPTYSLGSIVAT